MKFLLDENVETPITERLLNDGHEVLCVIELEKGISDEVVLEKANQEQAILVTADKDFGELVFRMKGLHQGVILIRLSELDPLRKSEVIPWTDTNDCGFFSTNT